MQFIPTMSPNPTIQAQGYRRGLMLALLMSNHPALEGWKQFKRRRLERIENQAFTATCLAVMALITVVFSFYRSLQSFGIDHPALWLAGPMTLLYFLGPEVISCSLTGRIEREAMHRLGYTDDKIELLHHQDCLQLIARAT